MGYGVWALLIGGADPEAVRGQTRPPERAVTPGELRTGTFDLPPDWLWVIDAQVRPAAGCLEALLAAVDAAAGLPAPALVASRVESADPLAQPLPRIDKELEIAAAERGVVAIRAVGSASFLVAPGSVSDALYAGDWFGFSAVLLAEAPAYLAPESEATLAGPVRERLGARARTLVNGTWRGAELPWFALQLLRAALTPRARLRSRRGRATPA